MAGVVQLWQPQIVGNRNWSRTGEDPKCPGILSISDNEWGGYGWITGEDPKCPRILSISDGE